MPPLILVDFLRDTRVHILMRFLRSLENQMIACLAIWAFVI